jgi:hypothetical protein
MIDFTNNFLSKLIMLKAQDRYVLRYCYRYKRRAVTNNKINPENGRLNAIYIYAFQSDTVALMFLFLLLFWGVEHKISCFHRLEACKEVV